MCKQHKTRFYITTPIYYPNGEAHIGHAYCTTMCDIFARYKRLRKYEVFFLTGTDEHGQKIKKYADKVHLKPLVYLNNMVNKFKNIWKIMNISNDYFIRTTNKKHIKTVQLFFSKMLKNNDIYLGTYEGWYCTECESFWSDVQVGDDHICPDCHRSVNKEKEESYFFKCTKYVDKIIEFYKKNPFFCYPKNKINEIINNFIKPGLQDLSISRINNDWGIPILENKKHTIYVWFDALINYVSALNFNNKNNNLYKKFWEDQHTEIIHVIGADISRFHCIYWLMFLLSCKIRLPDHIFVHGLIKIKDEKISKSKNNSINPIILINRYGLDAIRYFFAVGIKFGCDGNFNIEYFVKKLNNDLANQLGNLLNRTITMIEKYFNNIIPIFEINITNFDTELENNILDTVKKYEEYFDNLKITDAINEVMNLIDKANKYIDLTQPWLLKKKNKIYELKSVIAHLSHILYVSAILLSPVIINKYLIILDQLNVPKKKRNYNFLKKFGILNNCKIKKDKPFFQRFDIETEIKFYRDNILNKFL